MVKRLLPVFFVCLAGLLGPGKTEATPVTGSQGLAFVDIVANNATLASVTKFTILDVISTKVRTGDFLTANAPVVFFPTTTLDLSNISSFSLTDATWGTFTATTLVFDDIRVDARTFYIDGEFTPSSNWWGDSTKVMGTVILSFNQAGGTGKSIGGGGTLVVPRFVPPNSVPEPSTVISGLVGMGLLGGMALRRRKLA